MYSSPGDGGSGCRWHASESFVSRSWKQRVLGMTVVGTQCGENTLSSTVAKAQGTRWENFRGEELTFEPTTLTALFSSDRIKSLVLY